MAIASPCLSQHRDGHRATTFPRPPIRLKRRRQIRRPDLRVQRILATQARLAQPAEAVMTLMLIQWQQTRLRR